MYQTEVKVMLHGMTESSEEEFKVVRLMRFCCAYHLFTCVLSAVLAGSEFCRH